MHIVIPISGTLSGKLRDDLKDQLEQLQKAREIIQSLGLFLEIRLGDVEMEDVPFSSKYDIPTDAPCPELKDINEVEVLLEQVWRRGKRDLRPLVLEHLGYFRDLKPKLQEAIMAYYAPGSDTMSTLESAAKRLEVSSTTVNARVGDALFKVMRGSDGRLARCREACIQTITPETIQDEPVAVLDVDIYLRTTLRETGFATVGNVVSCPSAELHERLKWKDDYAIKEGRQELEAALQKWGLSLAA